MIHRLVATALQLGLLALSGCLTTYTNADHEFGVDRERILGRRYVVTTAARFDEVTLHWFPLGTGRPEAIGQIELSRGAVIRTQDIQHAQYYKINGGAHNSYRVDAIVTEGSHKGARIAVGELVTEEDVYPRLALASSFSNPRDGRSVVLRPLPDDPPRWLDTSTIPPKTCPLSTIDLASAARNRDWAIRYYAVMELARRVPDASAIAALGVAVNDDVGDVRAIAVEALGRAGSVGITTVDALVAHLRDEHIPSAEVELTEQALAAIGKGGYPKIATLLASASPRDVQRAAKTLEDVPPGEAREQVPALESALRRDPGWRDSIAYSTLLRAIARADPSTAMRIVIPELENPDFSTSYAAGNVLADIALGEMQVDGGSAKSDLIVHAFVAALNDPNASVRSNALGHLASMGGAARSAIPALEKLRVDQPKDNAEESFQSNLKCTLDALMNARPQGIERKQ